MKKIIRIIAITFGIIILILIITPILFKSKIETVVKEEVNKQVQAQVDWDKFGITFFRGFPDLSINLHGLSVTGNKPFEGDTLVALERFEFRVSPFSAFKKDVVVKSILLDRPLINGIVLEDGTANWDIVPPGEPEADEEIDEETGGTTSMGLSLKRFAIEHGRIMYSDQPGNMEASIKDMNLELSGDFAMEQTDVELMVGIYGITAKSGGVRYMKDGDLEVDVLAAADMINSLFTLKKNEIRLNGLTLGAEGTVKMPDDGSIVTDVRFFSKETSFKTLLSMVPAIYLSDFESLETRGTLSLDGHIKGVMKDSILPDATINLKVSDGFFSYPDVPKNVSDVQIDLAINYMGSDMDATTVNLNRFHLLLGDNPFSITMSVTNPFSDMHVMGNVDGMIDFATLKDVVPMEDVNLSGRLDAKLDWDTRMSFIENEEYERVKLDGKMIIEDMLVEAPDIPVPVNLQELALFFTPRYVNLETVDLLLGSSDMQIDGRLTNFIPYVFDNQTVAGELNVKSSLLDANELMPPSDTTSEEAAESIDQYPDADSETLAEADALPLADSAAVTASVKIPKNVFFNMTLDMKEILYDNIVMENLSGDLTVKDGTADLAGLQMDILKGTVAVKGIVDTRNAFPEANVQFDMKGIDIPTAYETFVTIERLAPVAKYCKGSANVDMDFFTKLDGDFNPLYETIDANGHLFARDLKVEQPPALEKLGSAIKSQNLKNLELEKADIKFAIREGRVIVEPFDMNIDNSKIVASGSHGIDQTMDYLLDMTIAKSDLGGAVNSLMTSMNALAAGAGISVPQSDYIKVKANITGTFNDPKVKTDLSGNLGGDGKQSVKEVAKQKVEEKVEVKVEEVKEVAKEEASKKAEEIIRAAEAQKVKLVAEAEAAGDKLVTEAEKKGEQLIEEAGRNPLKKLAAEKASEELVKQAQKKRQTLIDEAEAKGDGIIAKAKEEAAAL